MKITYRQMKYPLILIIFLLMLNAVNIAHAALDLDLMAQDYVLEAKQIHIPGCPYALNPSVARWNDGLIMCFRVRDPITQMPGQIGFIWLDEDFNPIGLPKILKRQVKDPTANTYPQDPRIVNIDEELYIVYSDLIEISDKEVRRMHVSKVDYNGVEFSIRFPECFYKFEGKHQLQEKNWVPMEYHGDLLLAYSQQPHKILKPVYGTNSCETIVKTKGDIQWDWGEIRGGTPALLVDGQYLAFFHALKGLTTVQSKGTNITHYFMGAYTFSSEPPFNITQISAEPILGKNFYNPPQYKTWKPLRVIYPGGYTFDENNIWIFYGRQDHEIWVVKIDKVGLYKSLIPVKTQP